MATAEERMQILRMIEEGKISAGDGAELLRALDRDKNNIQAQPLKGAAVVRGGSVYASQIPKPAVIRSTLISR